MLIFVIDLRLKASILAIIFLAGGSGFSVDISQCCSRISGISIGFSSSAAGNSEDCCKKIKPVSKKPCCTDLVFNTVINPVLGLQKTIVPVFKIFDQTFLTGSSLVANYQQVHVLQVSRFEAFDHHYPLPILLRKRVLQV